MELKNYRNSVKIEWCLGGKDFGCYAASQRLVVSWLKDEDSIEGYCFCCDFVFFRWEHIPFSIVLWNSGYSQKTALFSYCIYSFVYWFIVYFFLLPKIIWVSFGKRRKPTNTGIKWTVIYSWRWWWMGGITKMKRE